MPGSLSNRRKSEQLSSSTALPIIPHPAVATMAPVVSPPMRSPHPTRLALLVAGDTSGRPLFAITGDAVQRRGRAEEADLDLLPLAHGVQPAQVLVRGVDGALVDVLLLRAGGVRQHL